MTFSRNDGEEISDENPVEFGFNLVPDEKQEDGEAVTLETIEVTMGDHQVENGEVHVITAENEEGIILPIGNIMGKAVQLFIRHVCQAGRWQDNC